MENDSPVSEMTVNSSTYAIPFYKQLGFEPTGEIQSVNGMTFHPYEEITPLAYSPVPFGKSD